MTRGQKKILQKARLVEHYLEKGQPQMAQSAWEQMQKAAKEWKEPDQELLQEVAELGEIGHSAWIEEAKSGMPENQHKKTQATRRQTKPRNLLRSR